MRNQKADKQERYNSSVRAVVVLATSWNPPSLKSCEKGALSVTELYRMWGWCCCCCMSVAELVGELVAEYSRFCAGHPRRKKIEGVHIYAQESL